MPNAVAELIKLLATHGLTIRGALLLDAQEARALNAKSLFLVGHAGPSIWPHFAKWRDAQPETLSNPLDTWSKTIIAAAATEVGGYAVFPSDKPYLPFQQWAMQAEGLKLSPLGILIHPVFGLWHAYRGAILMPNEKLSQSVQKLSHPCDRCIEKPCLNACPVDAFSDGGYSVTACRSHLKAVDGQTCMTGGCLARLACPIGQEYAYGPEQMRFHMNAFAG